MKEDFEYPLTGNALIMVQIASLEVTQHRAVREFICGDQTAITRLKALNNQITALRAQLT